MKLALFTVVLILGLNLKSSSAGSPATNPNCVCSQWTCNTNYCEAPPAPPARACKIAAVKNVPGIYEESDGEYTYSIRGDSTADWNESVRKCQADGFTHLATIDSQAKWEFINNMLTKSGGRSQDTYGSQYWTSFNNQNGGAWKWDPRGSTYWDSAWEKAPVTGNCGALTSGYSINRAPCTPSVFRICQAPTCTQGPPGCKVPRGKVGNDIYEESDGQFVYSLQTAPKLKWTESVQNCRDQGFVHLATLNSEAQRKFVDKMLDSAGYRGATWGVNQLWTAYTRRGTPSAWRWEPSNSTYFEAAWWQPEPGGTNNPNEPASELDVCATFTSEGKYNDAQCEVYSLFRICQAPVCGY